MYNTNSETWATRNNLDSHRAITISYKNKKIIYEIVIARGESKLLGVAHVLLFML
jgi:hypothetical protein